jgi:hypothetical protein
MFAEKLMKNLLYGPALALLLFNACGQGAQQAAREDEEQAFADTLRYAEEIRLRNLRQLTFGGDNAEA